METIRFYSYKGGVGRSLLTAHVAKLLAACGKKVVVMDADFDAPGILTIFGLNPFESKVGFINLYQEKEFETLYGFDSFIKKEDWEKLCANDSFIRAFSNKIKDNLIDAKPSSGWLKLLPCGSPQYPAYWKSVFKIAEECTNSEDSNDTHVIFYYLNTIVKKALEALKVDYFLIDSRAGITCFGDITRSIADKEALIFCPNDDTRYVWSQLWDKKGKPKCWCSSPPSNWNPNPKFVCVVSRMPPELDVKTQLKFREMKTILTPKKQDKNFLGVLPLHSDLETHLNPRFRLENTVDSEIVQFHKDVCEILVTLCPEILSRNDKKLRTVQAKAYAFWLATFKRPLEITHINRLFDLYIKRGEMRNSDKNRNVAFKVETFLLFLNQIYDMQLYTLGLQPQFKDKYKRNAECQKRINEALEVAGEQCGKAFGKTLFIKKSKVTPDTKINKWCEFDTQAGFGRMEYKNNILTIEELFIRDSRITEHRDYTAFFTGYAQGVLNEIVSPLKIKYVERLTSEERNQNETKYKITFKPESK